MKWFQDNPVGLALTGIAAVLMLLVLGMSIVWTLPVTTKEDAVQVTEAATAGAVVASHRVADVVEFEVINEKPVFNESRLPVIEELVDEEGGVDDSIAIKDAPEVRLTGVIITPSRKIASLTPTDKNLESVMAYEGEALSGEFAGWQVSSVSARKVVLESRDGQKLDLELQVHDVAIKEPPKPVVAEVSEAEPAQAQALVDEDGQPLSRADQIRQRIAERREELRREQDEQQTESGAKKNSSDKVDRTKSYQNAIQAMLKNKRKDDSGDDNKDE
jgi:hypothetical protein